MNSAAPPTPQPTVDLAKLRVAFVRFANERAVRPERGEAPLPNALGRHVPRPQKSGPALGFALYAPGARRSNEGVLAVTALVLDLDHIPAASARALVRALRARGWAYLLYSSFSHRAAGPDDCCFRVVLPVNRLVLPGEYTALWSTVNTALGGLADPQARDLARMWYTPACPPERLALAVYERRDGLALDVDALVPPTQPSPAPLRAPAPVCARPDRARRIAQHRLNHDPAVRARAAERLQARVSATRASRVKCPSCGRRSVWFWLDPQRQRIATCNHRNSCGWWGFLDTLIDHRGTADDE